MVQGEINRGRHTDHPAGRHSIWTNQCPPPPSPHIFYRPDALPAAQPTVSKQRRQNEVHEVQNKQMDSHKVCLKCPPLAHKHASMLAVGQLCHQSATAPSLATHAADAVSVISVMNVIVTSYLRQI